VHTDFWLKANFFPERPSVTFNNKIVMEVLIRNKDSSDLIQQFWTTNAQVNDLFGDKLIFPQYSVQALSLVDIQKTINPLDRTYRHVDPNLAHLFIFEFQIPLESDQEVAGIRILMFFDYVFKFERHLELEALATFDEQFPLATDEVTFYGNLNFKQNIPFRRLYGVKNSDSVKDPLIDFAKIDSLDKLNPDEIVKTVANGRELTATIADVKRWWKPRISSLPTTGDRVFTLKAEVNVPVQMVFYEPGIVEVIKNAWIQYLSILVIFVIICHKIFGYLVVSGMLATRMQVASKKLI
jgi:transmembrane protein 231